MKFFSDDINAGLPVAKVEIKPLDPEVILRNAAAYVRMSTEHQQYSIANQLDVIREYAARHQWQIVKVYADEGRSGLSIEGREALSAMISDVLTKKVNFARIIVYDVSRWGRFQDPDEAAHYEFICRETGVTVHYCAEQFDNNLSLASTIAKTLKRAMAGEYSRELSAKVFRGALRLLQLGFKQGGSAVYGLRRVLIDQNGQRKAILKKGEMKCLQTDRVIYEPGPQAEIQVVRWIFEMFVARRWTASEITRQLNARGIPGVCGQSWQAGVVRLLLKNENYIGNLVYFRTSIKLGGPRVVNPPEKWIRKENAFQGIVPAEIFFQAREIFRTNRKKFKLTNDFMLDQMRALFIEHGRLSSELMKQLKKSPCPHTYRNHFGSLVNAYRMIGFNPPQDFSHHDIMRHINQVNQAMIAAIKQKMESLGVTVTWSAKARLLCLNGELRIGILFARHIVTDFGSSRWVLRWDSKRWQQPPDLTMAVRMDQQNQEILDYYLLPGKRYSKQKVRLAQKNSVYLDAYRFENLEFLVHLAARRPITSYEPRNQTHPH